MTGLLNTLRAGIVAVAAGICLLNSPQARSAAQRQPPKQQATPAPQLGVIRVGTRLVEVEVVVRDKNGPVTGLTREDFTILDEGKAQQIAVFNGGVTGGAVSSAPASGSPSQLAANPLPPGTVSNRTDRSGHPISGATVLLFDQLNTVFDNQGYARSEMLKFLESAPPGEQIAIYMLGKNLTVVQDFTDNRDALTQAVRKWDPKNLSLLMVSDENMDAVDRKAAGMSGPNEARIRAEITTEAISKVAQHLAGMPGRKNLVWLSDTPGNPGGQFLRAANVHLYPVLVRSVGTSGVVAWMRDARESGGFGVPVGIPAGNEIAKQHANTALAAANGSTAFMDSRDISIAVRTAVEDANSAYVLGFYPDEDSLDNKFHALTVNVGKKGLARGRTLEIHYRPGYFASRANGSAAPSSSLDSVLKNPLDSTAIGLSAVASDTHGNYEVVVTVDLHDIHFQPEDGRHVAALAVSFAVDGDQQVKTETLKMSLADAELATAIQNGLTFRKTLEEKSAMRVVVQDIATGVAGSLRIVPPESSEAQK